jgi:creatinine amidohydrolase/Fe(II)-dependent formamide hydrolase-like protein
VRLAELTKDDYLALDREHVVPVLPLGSIEQHGRHLPLPSFVRDFSSW